jgi:hypothetical protein
MKPITKSGSANFAAVFNAIAVAFPANLAVSFAPITAVAATEVLVSRLEFKLSGERLPLLVPEL